jgi:hypothetical protein
VGIAHQYISAHSINVETLFELNALAESLGTRIDKIFARVYGRSSKIAISEHTGGTRNKVSLLRFNIVCGQCPPYITVGIAHHIFASISFSNSTKNFFNLFAIIIVCGH